MAACWDCLRVISNKMESGGDRGAEKLSVVRVVGQEVKDFSSQYGAEDRMSYAAQNLAGESTIYPKYGDFTQACVFRTYGPWWRMAPSAPKPFRKTPEPDRLSCEDYIEVLFRERLYPVAVQVYETYNPGTIVRILGCDYQAGSSVDTGRQSQWRTLWSGPVTETPRRVRIFSPPIQKIDSRINLIRLELNHSLMHYYTELDCIMLCGVTTRPRPADYPYLQDQANQLVGNAPNPRVSQPSASAEEEEEEGGERKGGGQWWGLVPKQEEDKVREDLQSLSLQEQSDQPGSHLPQAFSTLPGEIIVMILGYLDFPSLGCVAQTCRLLQRHAYDCILYTELNLQPVWNLVNDSTLGGLAQRCESLQRLNMSWCNDSQLARDDGFLKLLSCCRDKLTYLQLSSCSFLTHDTLRIITSTCKNLKELDVSGCEEVDKVSGMYLIRLLELERLNLYRTKINTQTTISVIRTLGKLKHLNLGSCTMINNCGEVVEELGQHCPDLRSLDLWRAQNLQNSSFKAFVEGCPLLEELDVGWCAELNSRSGSFTKLAATCTNLKKLYLTANRTVCDTDMLALAKHCPKLQQLDILGTREVTRAAMDKVLSNCPDLVMVDVSFCAGITDPDVNEWSRMYPHINIKKSFQN